MNKELVVKLAKALLVIFLIITIAIFISSRYRVMNIAPLDEEPEAIIALLNVS